MVIHKHRTKLSRTRSCVQCMFINVFEHVHHQDVDKIYIGIYLFTYKITSLEEASLIVILENPTFPIQFLQVADLYLSILCSAQQQKVGV